MVNWILEERDECGRKREKKESSAQRFDPEAMFLIYFLLSLSSLEDAVNLSTAFLTLGALQLQAYIHPPQSLTQLPLPSCPSLSSRLSAMPHPPSTPTRSRLAPPPQGSSTPAPRSPAALRVGGRTASASPQGQSFSLILPRPAKEEQEAY